MGRCRSKCIHGMKYLCLGYYIPAKLNKQYKITYTTLNIKVDRLKSFSRVLEYFPKYIFFIRHRLRKFIYYLSGTTNLKEILYWVNIFS